MEQDAVASVLQVQHETARGERRCLTAPVDGAKNPTVTFFNRLKIVVDRFLEKEDDARNSLRTWTNTQRRRLHGKRSIWRCRCRFDATEGVTVLRRKTKEKGKESKVKTKIENLFLSAITWLTRLHLLNNQAAGQLVLDHFAFLEFRRCVVRTPMI